MEKQMTDETYKTQLAELDTKQKLLAAEAQKLQVIDQKLTAIDKLENEIKKLQADIARREQKK
jgi:hypothetical protein